MATSVRFCILIFALILVAPTAVISQPPPVVFLDNFDSYPPDLYPPSPWWNMFDGVSAIVSTEQYLSTPHSLRSESLPNWARWDCITLDIALPLRVLYTASVYLTASDRGASLGFGFVEPGAPNTGHIANALHFGNDGVVYFSTVTGGSTAISVWGPNHWISMAVEVDYVLSKSQVWYDGNPVVTELPADPKVLPDSYYGVEVPLNNFGVFGNNFTGAGTSVFYVDDVSIQFFSDPLPTELSTWGRVKSLYR